MERGKRILRFVGTVITVLAIASMFNLCTIICYASTLDDAVWVEPLREENVTVINSENPYRAIIMNASEQDLRELEGALYIECRGESWEGQLATGQVILNRVLSELYPNTIHGVLSQVDSGYKQYACYPKCKTCPRGEQQSDVIEMLCDGQLSDFPLTTAYVYQGHKQGKNRVKIDHQWFGTR